MWICKICRNAGFRRLSEFTQTNWTIKVLSNNTDVYSEPIQTSKMKLFEKIVNIWNQPHNITKIHVWIHVWMGSEYAHVIAYMVFTQSIYMNIRPRLLHVFSCAVHCFFKKYWMVSNWIPSIFRELQRYWKGNSLEIIWIFSYLQSNYT